MNLRTIFLSSLFYGLLLAGLITTRGELVALALPLALYLFSSMWDAPGEIGLEFQRSVSAERVSPGAPVSITLTVSNVGPALGEVLIEDKIPEGLTVEEGHTCHLLALKPGEVVSWTILVSGPRGCYAFNQVQVEVSEPMGLVQHEQSFATPGQLFILPPVLRLQQVAIRPRRTRVYSGNIPARTGGPGIEFFGVREYQNSDSPRWINWRASARHSQTIFSNEFEQERVADIGIILDGRMRTNALDAGHSLFEHSVLAAAALADAFLNQGNRVGLLLYGQYLRWTLPGYGKIQRERILQALSHAQPGENQVFADLGSIPTRLFPPHSQVVLVSPLIEDDLEMLLQFRANGYQVMLVSPDPVTYELSSLPDTEQVRQAARIVRMERQVLLQKVQRAGVQVLDWNVSVPFDKLVRTSLGRPPGWARAGI
ncbi:MAG: DUF58 domain-containing protein [Anaerolineales bacterium]|nr:DUF58 domain-containing protein [Anaerolineales bacterium]